MTRFDQIDHASLTDVGLRRSHNQDSHAVQLASDDEHWRECGHLFLVADGMGAHAVGERASEQAAQVIPHSYLKHANDGPIAALRTSISEANESIHACGQANREFEGADPRWITTAQERCVGCGTCVEVCPANQLNGGQTLRVMEAPTRDWFIALEEFEKGASN